ncbi:MAG: extracellular solute-binding protein [Proteocatella sp.]
MQRLKVLAVQDPAVSVYVDPAHDILGKFPEDIEVEFNIVSWDDYFKTMIESFEGKADYDIVMIAGHLWLRDFVDKGYLAAINYDFEDILPVIAKEMQCDGRTYLSPSFCDGHMVVYRKSMLSKVLDKLPEEVISTDEFIDIAQKLHMAGHDAPIALKANASEILLDAVPFLRSQGKDVYAQSGSETTCNIGKMESEVEKYISLRSLSPEDTNTYGNDEIRDLLAGRKVAMATTWSGQLGAVMKDCLEKEDLGFTTFDTSWNVTWSFAITNMSRNKDKAEKLLKYLRSSEIDALAGECSGAPVRKVNYIEGIEKYPWYKVQLRMIEEFAKPFVPVMKAGDKNGVLYEAIYSAFINEKSIKTALKEAQIKVDSI